MPCGYRSASPQGHALTHLNNSALLKEVHQVIKSHTVVQALHVNGTVVRVFIWIYRWAFPRKGGAVTVMYPSGLINQWSLLPASIHHKAKRTTNLTNKNEMELLAYFCLLKIKEAPNCSRQREYSTHLPGCWAPTHTHFWAMQLQSTT